MTRYVALLRGINVGGVRITMPELGDTFRGLGLEAVRTVLASGNVVFDADGATTADLKAATERALRDRFGYDAWVHVLPLDAVRAIVADYPFDTDEAVHHPYVVFCADPGTVAELAEHALAAPHDGERLAPGDGVVYWEAPKGGSTTTPFATLIAKARFKPLVTTRNLRTLRRLA